MMVKLMVKLMVKNRSAVAHVLLLDASKGSSDADVTLASGRVDLREMADKTGDCTVAP